MEQRKFFKYGISELEVIYIEGKNNISILEELEEELEYRSTQRARKLLATVQNNLAAVLGYAETSMPPQLSSANNLHLNLASNQKLSQEEKKIDWDNVLNSSYSFPSAIDNKQEKQAAQNKPLDILDTWTILEALSPKLYKQPQDLRIGSQGSIIYLRENQEPWKSKQKTNPKEKVYYVAYLGAINMEKATQKLLTIYQDKRLEQTTQRGFSAMAAVLLDKDGVPIPDTGLAISSFSWAYPQAAQGKLYNLKFWDNAEEILKLKLSRLIYKEDRHGTPLPIYFSDIKKSFQWLVKNCEIPMEDTSQPYFVTRLVQHPNRDEPETPILNSFYLKDLQRAKHDIEQETIGKALALYLGITKPKCFSNILKNKKQIESVLQPKFMPEAKWPSKGRHPLVLLQQTAVNLAKKELKHDGLFSVNGPPGTGKTTLLRDIIASVIVKRAKALYAFENTDNAFEHSGIEKLGSAFIHIYRLHESLLGHEILVSSTNNKAVENISKELPLKTQIAEDIDDFQYFKTISDALLDNNEKTWGLTAATLGNSANRNKFTQKVWWDYDSGLRNYFLSITNQFEPKLDKDNNKIIPKIITEEDPPKSMEDAKIRWKKARDFFKEALEKVEHAIMLSQKTYEILLEIEQLDLSIQPSLDEQEKLKKQTSLQKEKNVTIQTSLQQQSIEVSKNKERCHRLEITKPSFFSRLFLKSKWQRWKSEYTQILNQTTNSLEREKEARDNFNFGTSELSKIQYDLDHINAKIAEYQSQRALLLSEVKKTSSICGEKIITTKFWSLEHAEQQTFSPNFTDYTQLLRDNLFIAAVKLHKAFIDVASKQLRQNLSLFFDCLSGKKLSINNSSLLPHLWSSLFLLTPVISTTFASVGRMLSSLPQNSIGWLLIDEAGQATPQAAVGAIYRAKRVLSVGDPLQIEPVVTLPTSLVETISRYMRVDPYQWAAPDASVQTLSDKANSFGTIVPRDLSEMKIGSPLLVHRRCENPMFTISNTLAYNGLMVQATRPQYSKITKLFGTKFAWVDIKGSAQEKWCPEEGEYVVKMLLKGIRKSNGAPKIFVISPFRVVAENMSQRMRREIKKLSTLGIKDPDDWIKKNIGTVHTFQGREAEAVIFLLGAPSSTQNGARTWATSNVNLLNVAISRAKQNFYIVGNKELWSDLGNMKIFSRYIE